MPIDYKDYPKNWHTEIRPRILERAGDCCEWCSVPNRSWIVRDNTGKWHPLDQYIKDHASQSDDYLNEMYPGWDESPEGLKPVQITLTIAHLDHDEHNHAVKDERLAALCQKCHLDYDRPEKKRRKRIKQYEDSLFPLPNNQPPSCK